MAVLRLADGVPPGVTAAPLRCPAPHALRDRRWWAFGFAESRRGNSAYGTVGESLGDGYIRIDADRDAIYRLRSGFSGGGVWSPDFGSVIGVVVRADEHGNGEAVTIHQIDLCFPEEKLRELTQWMAGDAGQTALAAWGWLLEGDPEGFRHWQPRARGVSAGSERGFRFRGRSEALQAICGWLDRERLDRRALVVTGSPGAGKSAVLGRIVTTADLGAAAGLPASDLAVRAAPGSVACAVHAKGKTALEVAGEIARAASAALPDRIEDFAPALRAALAEREGRRFNVIIDALDEATAPAQARAIITGIIRPLVETCTDVGAQVVAGSRRHDPGGDLLAAFGESLQVLDLDDPVLFCGDDLTAYALATLRLEGDERDGNPYADVSVARPVAERIAELSDRNFLIAGLTARAHGLHDQEAADPTSLSFTATVDAAMREYMQRLSPVAGVPAEAALTALAFAEDPGIPLELWQDAAQTLGAGQFSKEQLVHFARSSAASFLVESVGEGRAAVFRLFHQALNDALLRARSQITAPGDDERALTRAFTAAGSRDRWGQAPRYLLRSLASHAARAGMIDDLLAEDAFLLHADLRRLVPLADRASSPAGRHRARLLRLTPRAITADPHTRIALFSVTETLENLGCSYAASNSPAPYRARWAKVTPRTERSVLDGLASRVWTVCTFTQDGRLLLASGGFDGTVRIWDPADGTELAALHGHDGSVNAVCAFTQEGRTLLATGSDDRTVRIWDPADGTEQATLHGHDGSVNAVCAFTQEGRTLLATGSDDRTVRIWDPADGTEQATLHGHDDWVRAVCAFTQEGRTLLATGSVDGTVRIWDPADGTEQATLHGHDGDVNAVCAFTREGRTLLATGSSDRTVRIWDLADGTERATLDGHDGWVRAVCAFTHEGRTLLATGSDDRTVRIWDLADGTELATLDGHDDSVRAVCAFTTRDGRTLLATGSSDRTVRIWDPADGTEQATLNGHDGSVRAVCAFTHEGRTLLATGSDDRTVRIWDLADGTERATLDGHDDSVRAVCAFTTRDGRTLLATGSVDGTVRIWDPADGIEQATLHGHDDSVRAVCAFTTRDGRTLLATGSDDRTVRIWDPADGIEQAALHGHDDWVSAVCAFTQDGRTLLASGSSDRTVRIWDPVIASALLAVPVHHPVHAIDYDSGLLVTAVTAGLLAIQLDLTPNDS